MEPAPVRVEYNGSRLGGARRTGPSSSALCPAQLGVSLRREGTNLLSSDSGGEEDKGQQRLAVEHREY